MKSAILLTLLVTLAFSANASSIKHRMAATLFKGYMNNLQASSDEQPANLGTTLKTFLVSVQHMMPCGFSLLNIPVLAPMTDDLLEVIFTNPNYNITLNISDIFVPGLNDFQALKINYDESSQILSYDINFSELKFLAEYSGEASAILAGFFVQIAGDGIFDMVLNDFRLVGSFQIGTDPNNSSSLKMSNFHLKFYVGNTLYHNWNKQWDNSMNNFINKWAGETVDIFMQQYNPDNYFQQEIVPLVNHALQGVSMGNLISFFASISQKFNSANC